MKIKKFAGQITIFAALSFTIIISLICVCVESAVQVNLMTEIDMASRLAVESAFAGYSAELLNEFDVFALEKESMGNKILKHYTQDNINGICGKNKVEYINAEFEEKVCLTDQAGVGIEKQILAYMNVGIYTKLLQNMLDIEKETQKVQIVKEITDEVVKCEETMMQADSIIFEVIALVEGIQTTSTGVIVRNGKAVANGEYFAKAIITAPLSKEVAAIEKDAVYSAVSGMSTKYLNVFEVMDNMVEYADAYKTFPQPENGASDSQGAQECVNGYKKNYETLRGALSSVIAKTETAMSKMSEYSQKFKECKSGFDKCTDLVVANKEALGDELNTSLSQDIADMKNTSQYVGQQMCNTVFMKVGLEHNLTILKRAYTSVEQLNVDLSQKSVGEIAQLVEMCKGKFRGIDNKLLSFNYDNINFEKSGSGTKVIKTLQNTLANGIGGLVLGDRQVSQCSITYTDLASAQMGVASETTSGGTGIMEDVKNLALINEYVMDRFPSATDYEENQDDDNQVKQWCELNYVIEYILCGKSSDRENLNSVLLQLVAIREGINMSYLILDKGKKQEAMTLATSLVGATGNMAVVKVAQYLILAVWALGESICDLQQLLDGEAVPLIKTKDTWNLSLTNLLAMNFNRETGESGGDKADSGKKNSLTDMLYEDYLRILLTTLNKTEKRFRIMDSMELRIIALGEEGFRLKDYMWSASGVITLKLKSTEEYYIRKIAYSYA